MPPPGPTTVQRQVGLARSRQTAVMSSGADQVAPAAGGWAALSRNLLVAQDGAEPVLVESNALIPQDSVTDDYRPYAWWAAGGVAALALAGLAGAFAYRRANRRAKAQAAAEAAASGPQSAAAGSSDDR